ncbi:uncharacterized protein LOC111711042, partial [Eurytemora carolleeae]|uniref:uncharacterized protein LOC111711042 n=1 Tax=Eurytemora carolleeae TaxID=1294199 RepID=UPI000C774071
VLYQRCTVYPIYRYESCRFYINGVRFILTGLGPLLVLILLNWKIFIGVKYSHVRSSNRARYEVKLASILLYIVLVFLVCNFPRILLNFYEFVLEEEITRCGDRIRVPNWFICLTSLNHVLLTFSSSANFFIYISFKDNTFCCLKSREEQGPESFNMVVVNAENAVEVYQDITPTVISKFSMYDMEDQRSENTRDLRDMVNQE